MVMGMANICEKCTHRNVCRYQEPCEECNQFAEEVVRCKDCKQYEYIVYDYGRCRKTMLLIKNDDFCSYGERTNNE